jgi:tagatose 6-phosphate kinase
VVRKGLHGIVEEHIALSHAVFICISPNPAIDKRLTVSSLVPGQVHRVRAVQRFPGGKAAHVAMVLRTLGEAPQWIGPCGGTTGAELVSGLSALGILVHRSETHQPTRTNLEIIEGNGAVTEILEPGCAPSATELSAFESACKKLFSMVGETGSVVFSGSLPADAPADLYARFIWLAREAGCRTFLDTSGEPLRQALVARPDFVKPNREEAAGLLGVAIDSQTSAVDAVRRLIRLGAKSAALSLGVEGLLFCPAENAPVFIAVPPPLRPRSAVGSGDSALAGIAHAVSSGASPEDTLRLGTACAAANCLAESPGAARIEDIRRFQNEIRVRALQAGPQCS